MKIKLEYTEDYVLLVNKDASITEGDYIINENFLGIIKASNEWHPNGEKSDDWNKIVAYRELNSKALELDSLLKLPKIGDNFDDTKWDNIAKEDWISRGGEGKSGFHMYRQGYLHGAFKHYKSEKIFTLKDVKNIILLARELGPAYEFTYTEKEILNKIARSKLPKYFKPGVRIGINMPGETDENKNPFDSDLKIRVNSEGERELAGFYIYD